MNLDNIIDIFFLIDFLINFNLAYYDDNNNLITDRKKIFYNYLYGYLFLDLISSIPLNYFISSHN